jgi:hypothetical protein
MVCEDDPQRTQRNIKNPFVLIRVIRGCSHGQGKRGRIILIYTVFAFPLEAWWMYASLRALLNGLLDYAGLFPPAALPFHQAIRNYAHYRSGADGWMLGRFVCPSGLLADVGRFVPWLFDVGPPLALSVLVGKGKDSAELLASLRDELRAVAELQQEHGERVTVEALEVRLPALTGLKPEQVAELVTAANEIIESAIRGAVTTYYEVPQGPGWQEGVKNVLSGLALSVPVAGPAEQVFSRPARLKLRCGGEAPSAFPSSEQLAWVLCQCRQRRIAWKATAGLHHPFRRFQTPLRAPLHGFINLFGAAVLAHARNLGEEQVRAILEDEEPSHFLFDEQGFRWGDVAITTPEITAAREQFAVSFGSCSFDEPREDLRALGWL